MYIRETPNEKETAEVAKQFSDHDCIIGDLNLNPAIVIVEQKSKLRMTCGTSKYMALTEITTSKNNQLDHIILEKELSEQTFVTAYNNFASYHKSIVLRICSTKNRLRKEFIEHINFDIDNHYKFKKIKVEQNTTQDIMTIQNLKKLVHKNLL